MKEVLHLLSFATGICQYPDFMSRVLINVVTLAEWSWSSIRGIGYLSGDVTALNFPLSFFLTSMTFFSFS